MLASVGFPRACVIMLHLLWAPLYVSGKSRCSAASGSKAWHAQARDTPFRRQMWAHLAPCGSDLEN